MKQYVLYGALLLTACGTGKQQQDRKKDSAVISAIPRETHFGADVAFLQKYVKTIILEDSTSKAAIAIVPAWQGRVMTSTAAGDTGRSLGWLNHDLIESGQHISAYGGEDRFSLGPEGSRNSFYFAPGDTFDVAHWRAPAPIDTGSFNVTAQSRHAVTVEKDMQLINYKGHTFHIKATRTITLIARRDIRNYIGTDLHKSVHAVAFHSASSITNAGTEKWDTAYGMPSIRILGMFAASEQNTVVVPIRNKGKVNTDYSGEIPAERLKVNEKIACFRADARYRSKIGLQQNSCYNYLGSYDAAQRLLTIVQFTLPTGRNLYPNSSWNPAAAPFGGDVISATNSDAQTGSFFELESSSPAARLRPGGHIEHYHRTIHLQGDEKRLDPIVRKLFGVTLNEIKKAL